ncbi:DUF2889 domain-containing protein [Novosphingobium colocasiae]|uniref:DUF2889 domain-containing protein n=1 Tax=Novosphingobium colocasiae TaxID=1256513 RepID=UPI0035B4CEC9
MPLPRRTKVVPDLPRPLNPDYGSGTFRRRLTYRVKAGPGGATARMHLLDVFHDMQVVIRVEAGRVAAVDGAMARHPNTTCPGAIAALQDLVGLPLIGAAQTLRQAAMSRHCTHLRDAASWVLGALERGEPDFITEFAVTDADAADRQHLTMTTNGVVRLALDLEAMVITAPAALAGRAMFGGFGRWVDATYAGREADDWRMTQIAFFVARGRRWRVDGDPGIAVGVEHSREGVCHAFTRPSFPDALSIVGFTRDFSAGLPPVEEVE